MTSTMRNAVATLREDLHYVAARTKEIYTRPDENRSNTYSPYETRIEGTVEAAAAAVGIIPGCGLAMMFSAMRGFQIDPHPAALRVALGGAAQSILALPLLYVGIPEALAAGALLALPGLARGLGKLVGASWAVEPSQ